MATAQDNFGNGIVTLLSASPFTSFIDGATYGYESRTLMPRCAVVRPLDAISEPEFTYDDSARIQMTFDVFFQLNDRATPHEDVSGIQNAMRAKLGDGGISLYSAMSVPSDINGGGILVTLGVGTLTAAGDIEPALDSVNPDWAFLHFPVTVNAWQVYA